MGIDFERLRSIISYKLREGNRKLLKINQRTEKMQVCRNNLYKRGDRNHTYTLVFVLLMLITIFCFVFMYIGAENINFATIFKSFVNYDPENIQELLIQTLRWPRLITALVCGVSFAIAGALIQGITNNPMGSPSILGINSGAAFGLSIAMIIFPAADMNVTVLFSFAGSALATGCVLLLANRRENKTTHVYLALAGTAIGAVFHAVTQALVVYFDVAQDLSYWTAGGISGIRMEQVKIILPWTFLGVMIAMGIAKSITLLSFGEEIAIGLGRKVYFIRILAGAAVLLLSGSAVAIAGPVGFIGLITPHMARKLIGIDYQKVIPFSAMLGALLVVLADIAARIIHPPFETPLGAVTALIGVPFFIYLLTRKSVAR